MPTKDESAALDLIRQARDATAALKPDAPGDQAAAVDALHDAESRLWAVIGRRLDNEGAVDYAAALDAIAANPEDATVVREVLADVGVADVKPVPVDIEPVQESRGP